MREESQLDDMRDAIRGDFERLEERRGDQVLLRPRERPEIAAHPTAPPTREADDTETVGSDEVGEPPKRSWIDRLLGL